MEKLMTAADLYAIACNSRNSGDSACHWCGSACQRIWLHDDVPIIEGVRSTSTARCPGNPWICVGCWLWRRRSVTAVSLGAYPKRLKDRQQAKDHSWWITKAGAYTTDELADYPALKELLLKPPLAFCLAFKGDGPNLLQLAVANDLAEIDGDTRLGFTLAGIPHWYTTYELGEAIAKGPTGKEPGVQALYRLLGIKPAPAIKAEDAPKLDRGRPIGTGKSDNTPKKVIARSGVGVA